MKKYILPAFIILAIIGLFTFKNPILNRFQSPTKTAQPENKMSVTLNIDYGDKTTKNFSYSTTKDETAFSVLKNVAERENITLETKQYDFGVFIQKIDKFESTAKNAWIYYVNGEAGQVAADQYKVKDSDNITWKFEPVKY